MKNKVHFLKGLPGSGKSKWAKEYVAQHPDRAIRVNKDDLRNLLHDSRYSKPNEKFVLLVRDAVIVKAMSQGLQIVVDDTNFEQKHYDAVKALVDANEYDFHQDNAEYQYELEVKFFDVPVEECIERDKKRANPVGEKVIREMQKKYLTTTKSCDKIVQDKSLPRAIICDLDGTLALHNGRGPFEYNKCDTDLLNKPIAKMLYFLKEQYNIIFLSGREDSCREKTKKWLLDNGFDVEILINKTVSTALLMRKTGDHRKDCIIKREIFDAEIKDKYYIDFVLDDRNQVVEMWRQLGLTCLQVAEGNF